MIPPKIATEQWLDRPFYKNATVLGIDIGIGGIGVALRRGPEVIFGRSYIVPTPKSAALEDRRLLRSARRCRKQRDRRDFLLRMFCDKHLEGAWSPITTRVLEHRLRGIQGKLKSPHALVQCLRHIVAHRGYAYHLQSEGAFLWGDSDKFGDAVNWIKAAYCDKGVASMLRAQSEELEWSDDQRARLFELCDEAVRAGAERSIEATLKRHLAKAGGNKREGFRGNAWPREHVEDHFETICRKHPQFFGGKENLEKLLPRLLKILHYERKDARARAEHARGKAGKCDIAPALLNKTDLVRGFQGNVSIRLLSLFDFLSTRRVATTDGLLHYPLPSSIYDLVDFVKKDAKAASDNQVRPKPTITELKKDLVAAINKAQGLKGKAALKLEKGSTLNTAYFTQLKDLLCPRRSSFESRATLSAEAAEHIVGPLLTTPVTRVSAISVALEEYRKLRRDRIRSIITSPQVEFLLGREGKIEGKLQRLFARPEIMEKLGGATRPDFVVVEVVGGAARNSREAAEISKAQLENRKRREKLIEQHGIGEADANRKTMQRVNLYEQQRGLCPYSGEPLGSPTSPGLQIDHIFPREQGGTSESRNLVLSHGKYNAAKGKRLPHEAAHAGVLPLDWAQMLELTKTMRWGSTGREGQLSKSDIFQMTDSSQCPEWGNLTRQSQIARELREAVGAWLGLKGDATRMASRIGTPTGLHTAVCRRAWKESIPGKDRSNLTHHLWDAITVSFIPPAKGMNTTEYGGIFRHVEDAGGAVTKMTALPLCPDLSDFEKDSTECLVERPRQSSNKQSRFDKSIYGLRGDGNCFIRKPLTKGETPANDERTLLEALKASGIPEEKIPPLNKIRDWLDSESDSPLRLRDGTAVSSIPTKAQKSGGIMTRVPHRNKEGKAIGVRVAGEANWRMEVWKTGDLQGVKYHRRVVPHPRALRIFKAAHGERAWKSKREGTAETWRHSITGKLPAYAKKVGHFEKGQIVNVPLMRDGKIADSYNTAYKVVPFRVTSLRSDGVVEMKMAAIKDPKGDKAKWPLPDLPMKAFTVVPRSPSKLALLLRGA